MEMVKAVGLKRYYDIEENEVRALDDESVCGRRRISCHCGNFGERENDAS